MTFKAAILRFAILVVIPTSLFAAASAVPAPATFSLTTRTQIPGETLKPGNYSIQVLDRLSDRIIIRIENAQGKDRNLFLAVPGTHSGSGVGVIPWRSKLDGVPALRGFTFASGYTVEFVYPKAEAAGLAKENDEKVTAMDPESEGRPNLRHMSQDDMHMINLWLLSLTTTGPNDKTPAILAQHYQNVQGANQRQVGLRNPVPNFAASHSVAIADQAGARLALSASPGSIAPRKPKAVVAVLPHTASSLPLIALVGLISLGLSILQLLWSRTNRNV